PIPAAAARNLGAAAATGEYLLFVDADCLLEPDALERLLEAAQAGYGALVGGVLPEPHPYWVLCSNLMAFPEYLTLDRAGERGSLPSFCLMMPRRIWEVIGGFDESYHPTCEDLDLCFRLRRAGYRLGCAPSAAVRHRSSRASAGAVWRQHALYGKGYYRIQHTYSDIVGPSQAAWLAEHLPRLAAALSVPIAVIFVLRMFVRRPHMLRFWHALPGLIWIRLAWYDGFRMASTPAPRPGAAVWRGTASPNRSIP
ncbi:MAG TPA: glycosyltransferase, partial [Roseiflexaceae bacterium]|nr:glycosyltransferase [Roseiflexaceae bacterium]